MRTLIDLLCVLSLAILLVVAVPAYAKTPVAAAGNDTESVVLYAEKCNIASVLERIADIAKQIGEIKESFLADYERKEAGVVAEKLQGCYFFDPRQPAIGLVWEDSGEALVPMQVFSAPPAKEDGAR